MRWRDDVKRRLRPVVDLTEETAFTLRLLDRPLEWRQRRVEDLLFAGADHGRCTTTLPIAIPPGILDEFEIQPWTASINALLPISTRPKRLALNLDLSGPGGTSAKLLRRVDIAAIQAEYLGLLVRTSSATGITTGLPAAVLEAVCGFTPGRAEEYARAAGPIGARVDWLPAYLDAGLGWTVDRVLVAELHERTIGAGELLRKALQEPHDPFSSSDCVLLAVPHIDPKPASPPELEHLVTSYCDAVEALAEADDVLLLQQLAEYGRRWEMVVEVNIPCREPATIRIAEDEHLDLASGRTSHRLDLLGGRSFHLQPRTTDPATSIRRLEVRDAMGQPVPSKAFEGARATGEFHAIYTSDPWGERPTVVDVEVRLAPSADARVISWSVGLFALLSLVAVWTFDVHTDDAFIGALALVTLPTTIASSLLLVREQAPLAHSLQRRSRVLVALVTGALWFSAILRFVDQFASWRS